MVQSSALVALRSLCACVGALMLMIQYLMRIVVTLPFQVAEKLSHSTKLLGKQEGT